MKKDISKSKNVRVVKNNNNLKKKVHKDKKINIKKSLVINISIGFLSILLVGLFIFIIFNVIKHINKKIDRENTIMMETYTSENKKICFEKECFYIIDYSIEDRIVFLFAEKNIMLNEHPVQTDEETVSFDRKDINQYLKYYKKTLEDLDVEVIDIYLPTYNQLEKNGCSFNSNAANIYTCSSDNSWIYSTSYYYDGDISGVMVNIGGLDSHFIFPFDMNDEELDNTYGKDMVLNVGVRPVIKIRISEIN